LVAILVEVLVDVLLLVRAGLKAFSAAAALVVRAAAMVDGVGTLGSDPVATSAVVSLVMPGRFMMAYVRHRLFEALEGLSLLVVKTAKRM
jgi:hypothetical protein